MVTDAAWSLRCRVPSPRRDRVRDGRPRGDLVPLDQPDRLLDGEEDLEAADDDALEWVADDRTQPHFASRLLDQLRQAVEVERITGEGPDVIGPSPDHRRLERVRVRNVLLDKDLLEPAHRDVEPAARDDPALRDRVLLPVPERDKLIIPLEIGKREAARPADQLPRDPTRPLQLLAQRRKLRSRRQAVEAPHPQIDRMDLPPANHREDPIAQLLEAKGLANHLWMILGHADRVLIAEEVRRMQHGDVEHVALDPLPAIDQPAQVPQRSLDPHAEDRLHRLHRPHLVGNGADATDPCGDVRRFLVETSSQQALEETRRLEDSQLDIGHLVAAQPDGERPLPFDPREVAHLDRSRATLWTVRHASHSLSGRVRHKR